MKTVYIQKSVTGEILNQGCYTAYYGFQKLGYRICFYNSVFDFIRKHQYPAAAIVGGIDTLRNIMDNLGIKQPQVPQPHKLISGSLGRKMYESTIKDFLEYCLSENFTPKFVKPLTGDKTFTGYVVKNPRIDILPLKRLAPEFELLISEVVDFQSEFRVFIKDRQILDIKNYTGNFWLRPGKAEVENAIVGYSHKQPICYSLDFGITNEGKTLLIEINDAFGIAPYGLDPVKYALFLEARWKELELERSYSKISG